VGGRVEPFAWEMLVQLVLAIQNVTCAGDRYEKDVE